jgi:plastocyanin
VTKKTTIKLLGAAAVSAFLVLGGSSASAKVHVKANGEIIGIVEEGTTRTANAVVSLTDVTGTFPAPSEPVIMDQKNKEFEPHVLAVMKGTKVLFKNSDPYLHNVFSSSRVKMFNVSQANKGDSSELTFDKPGLIPIKCHIHANMKAYIVVLSNPYFAVTNEKGQFQIGNVPAGTYTLKVWTDHTSPTTQTIEVSAGGRAKAIVKLAH